MVFTNIHELGTSGQTGGGYGVPVIGSPNNIDIRSWQTYRPQATESRVDITSSTWQRMATGATADIDLEVGVTIKHKGAPAAFKVNIATYNSDTEVGTTGGSGFQLGGGEEVFIAVRNLRDVWLKESGLSFQQGELVYYAR